MDKNYYREYFDVERNHWWFRARSEILKQYIERFVAKNNQSKILNAGVATGATTTMLQQFGSVTSLEYEQECIDFVRDKVPFPITQGSILELPYPDNAFDLVCAFDVIEHVEDDALAVREMIRVCKPGGSVCVTVPAFMSLWSSHDEINHHFRRYRLRQLSTLFTGNHGRVVFASYFNFILFVPIYFARLISRMFSGNEKPKSDFERYKPGVLGGILFHLLRSESALLKKGLALPIGVSALAHFQKNG